MKRSINHQSEIETVEAARAFLESEGIDVDAEIKKGLEHIEMVKRKVQHNIPSKNNK